MNTCTGAAEYGNLVYYSHILPFVISVVILFFILYKSKFNLTSLLFSIFLISFNIWLLLDIVTWISTDYLLIIMFWSPLDLINLFFYISATYFFIVFVCGEDIGLRLKAFLITLLLPAYVITLFGSSVIDFDSSNCEAINNPFLTNYKIIVEFISIAIIVWHTYYSLHAENSKSRKKEIIVMSIAINTFLVAFAVTEFISSNTGIYEINLYCLLIIPVFLFVIVLLMTNSQSFKIKIDGTKLLVCILIALTGSGLFFVNNSSYNQLNIITFILSLSFGILLIKMMIQEKSNLSKISSLASSLQSLNATLSDKVTEQTAQITHTYELEKKARRDLEKFIDTKDKFISIAQHNLRIPITNIFHILTSTPSPSVDMRIYDEKVLSIKASANELRNIADDFKNISQLKSGEYILNLTETSLLPILQNIINELKIDIEKRRLTINYPDDILVWPKIKVDERKIRDALLIIIENAVLYNTHGGTITITPNTIDSIFKLAVRNTGIGITKEEKANLLTKSFFRSERVRKVNPSGMGIGFFLSRSIIEAHHGKIEISSEGNGKGAEVIIEIPLHFKCN